MPTAKLIFGDKEFILGSGRASIGRAPDNTVALADDPNISRYHTEVERRDDEYWLIDLGSSNGTSVNGRRVKGEMRLSNGDAIVLGGSARGRIEIEQEAMPIIDTGVDAEDLSAGNAASATEPTPSMPEKVSNSHAPLILAGAAAGLLLVGVVAVGAIYIFTRSGCDATATISKPETGDTIITATEIEVDVENGACVSRAVFTIDGIEFADADGAPFSATIDPKEFPDLADGYDHALVVTLEDEDGLQISGAAPVILALESREISKPAAANGTAPEANTSPGQVTPATSRGQASLLDINEMSKRLAKQFPGPVAYNISNKQFLQEIQKRASEYAVEGYFERAAKYRDPINVAFVREQNLAAPLGFFLAMSRSKFIPEKQGAEEGMWRMNAVFAAANGYTGLCGTEPLTDASQNCAAKAAAVYMKALVLGVFDGDVIYSVAAFGRSPQDAGAWKATLPANRADVWNSVKGAAEREQLIRFFAAGIVTENPEKFGLKKDRPIAELYRLAM